MEDNGGIRHGFSNALYQRVAENRVLVTTDSGATGIFDGEGRWVEGEIYEADPEMCIWLTAKRIESSHRLS
ncbi:MAG: hypothetical protein CL427_04660 [Acidimicrobiaceae bacterium]|jgi:hypothetical protein|nr:hypothetical protein [Acidimicrobiaceae bacterium]